MAQVNFDKGEINAAVQKAIFDALTPDKRDELLVEAIKQLTTDANTYGSRKSHLQEIFESAVRKVAEEIVREMLGEPEHKNKLRGFLIECFERATTGDGREKIVEKVADGMARAFSTDRYS